MWTPYDASNDRLSAGRARLLAFEGWNDACDAASGALRHALSRWNVNRPFAVIESEEFFDFQGHRPEVTVLDGRVESMSWPETRFYAVIRPDQDHDLVVVVGDEPTFRWKTFARTVTAVLSDCGVESATVLGAYIGSVTHSMPVPLSGVATDPTTLAASGLPPTNYDGPTGIVAVLGEACKETGIPATSIWAATPHYLAANENPMAMRALLRKAGQIIGFAGTAKNYAVSRPSSSCRSTRRSPNPTISPSTSERSPRTTERWIQVGRANCSTRSNASSKTSSAANPGFSTLHMTPSARGRERRDSPGHSVGPPRTEKAENPGFADLVGNEHRPR